jgi:hypothetical protein
MNAASNTENERSKELELAHAKAGLDNIIVQVLKELPNESTFRPKVDARRSACRRDPEGSRPAAA